ncbi:MAG: hypothetical protein A4E53_04436 [Pelotomaculum sp. PtaB.Bin104]|nr:MAG: hypothetical protein A4E53_04436 [Pelotomaculum sp. PtaB.Bin104]
MDRAILVFLIFFSLLLFLLLTTVRLWINYSRLGCKDRFVMGFSAWRGLIYYQIKLPAIKLKQKKRWPQLNLRARLEGRAGQVLIKKKKAVPLSRLLGSISKSIRAWRVYRSAIDYLLDKVKLHRLTWRTELGTGDPAQTGLLIGLAWGVKGFILTVVYHLLTPGGAPPVVEISPSFQKACFKTAFDCVFEVRLGYLLITGFKALVIKYK